MWRRRVFGERRADPDPPSSEETRFGSVRVVKASASAGLTAPQIIGRYALFDEIASGGMGVVYFGRLAGPAGFERVVAVKRVRAIVAREPHFIAMFREEVRLLSRIRHPNVVAALDVVEDNGELLLIMEYVHGQPLSLVTRSVWDAQSTIPVEVSVAIVYGVLTGLHAVHEATTAMGAPLGIVHRDVSPQNILLGCDGVSRILDFGVAKAANSRAPLTGDGHVKGKLGYIAPEQLRGEDIDRRADLYGLSVVLWELLAQTRLFERKTHTDTVREVLSGRVPRIQHRTQNRVTLALEEIARRGLSLEPDARFASAREMAVALQSVVALAPTQDIGEWVTRVAHGGLVERSRRLAWAENCPIAPEIEVEEAFDDLTVRGPTLTQQELCTEVDARVTLPDATGPSDEAITG
jgi:serine/threonine-protein kinase